MINDQEMLQLMENIIDNPYMGVVYINTQSEILLVNDTFAHILGVERDSLIGRHIHEVIPKSRLPQTAKTGETNLCEMCIRDRLMVVLPVPLAPKKKFNFFRSLIDVVMVPNVAVLQISIFVIMTR